MATLVPVEKKISTEVKVLILDGDSALMRSLQRTHPDLADEWDFRVVGSSAEGLSLLDSFSADVVISDFNISSEQTGLEALEMIAEKDPSTIRILTADQADRRMAVSAASAAHQFISKNSPPAEFLEAINRALNLRNIVSSPSLRSLVGGIKSLPSLPSLYLDITRELRSKDPNVEALVKSIEMDPAIAAKVLQLVNSGFFGLPNKIADVGEASRLLGIEILQSLVLLSGVFSQFEQQGGIFLSIHSYWKHSLAVGRLSQAVVRFLPNGDAFRQETFTAGLLHDIGDLILSVYRHREHVQANQIASSEGLPRHRVERQLMGASHAEAGAYLLNLWGLPSTTVEAVALHHDPMKSPCESASVLTAVHLANALEHERKSGGRVPAGSTFDRKYLKKLGLEDKIDAQSSEENLPAVAHGALRLICYLLVRRCLSISTDFRG